MRLPRGKRRTSNLSAHAGPILTFAVQTIFPNWNAIGKNSASRTDRCMLQWPVKTTSRFATRNKQSLDRTLNGKLEQLYSQLLQLTPNPVTSNTLSFVDLDLGSRARSWNDVALSLVLWNQLCKFQQRRSKNRLDYGRGPAYEPLLMCFCGRKRFLARSASELQPTHKRRYIQVPFRVGSGNEAPTGCDVVPHSRGACSVAWVRGEVARQRRVGGLFSISANRARCGAVTSSGSGITRRDAFLRPTFLLSERAGFAALVSGSGSSSSLMKRGAGGAAGLRMSHRRRRRF